MGKKLRSPSIPKEWEDGFRKIVKARVDYLRANRIFGVEVAQRAGMEYTHFNAIIKGRQGATIGTWMRIVKATDGKMIPAKIVYEAQSRDE